MNSEYSRARKNKDKNFDGQFLFGVKTTGIFCRPSCPARVAKEENVVYFNSPYEALEQGYRPCRRCRPDILIEKYNGNIRGAELVKTAIKKMADGYLVYHSLEDLARELKVSDRHLRHLFIQNIGVPPVKVGIYQKVLFARQLLISAPDRTITDIALACGFRSIRPFNDAFKSAFGKTPSAVRKDQKAGMLSSGGMTILLHYTPPFSMDQMLAFMRPRVLRGVEHVTATTYRRTFRLNQACGWFEVSHLPKKHALKLEIFSDDIRSCFPIYSRVRTLFDLDTDFTLINRAFCKDPDLAPGMAGGHVPRLPAAFNRYEFAIRAILGQQVSVKAATTAASRVAQTANLRTPDHYPGELKYFFPAPDEVLPMDLSGIGITNTRQTTIKTMTSALRNQQFSLTSDQSFTTFKHEFSALKGIGNWTVNYVAMRGLGFKDCFPAGDLGVIRALEGKGKRLAERQILQHAEAWRPYRTYAALCLWNRP